MLHCAFLISHTMKILLFVCTITLLVTITTALVDPVERNVLVELYNKNGGATWRMNDNWLNGDPCTQQWFGVECSDDGIHITGVMMSHNNVQGVLPQSIGKLTMLEEIDFGVNSLTGPLPKELGNCVHLMAVGLRENHLTGPIPDTLGNCKNMMWWHSAFNHLESLPPTLAAWTNIKVFDVAHNDIVGEIPQFFSNMTSLQMLFIGHNMMTGTLPVLNGLSNLLVLDVGYNKMSPCNIQDILPVGSPKLIEIDLYGNSLLSGQLPSDLLTRFPQLVVFAAAHGSIRGIIPESLGTSSTLNILSLEGNQLTGRLGLSNTNVPLINLTGNPFFCPTPDYAKKFGATCSYWAMKRLTPMDGPLSGNVPVAIQGVGFLPLQPLTISVSFGNKIVPARVLDATTITCTTPPGDAIGKVAVNLMYDGAPLTPPGNVIYYNYVKNATGRSGLAEILIVPENLKRPMLMSRNVMGRADAGDKVSVAIFGESKCPDFSSIEEVWIDVYDKVSTIMDVTWGFIAKKDDTYPTGFWSLHGQTEVIGDKYTACVLNHYDMKTFFAFTQCINAKQSSIPVNIPACLRLDKESIQSCAFGTEGQVLMTKSVALADSYGAAWSPTIYVNGIQYCLWHSSPCPANNADDFVSAVCRNYKGPNPPPACK